MHDLKHNIYNWGFLGNLIKLPVDFNPSKPPIKNKYNNKYKHKKK